MNWKILIIDDELDARNLIKEYIEELSFFTIVGECKNGIDAVKAIDDIQPDCIFLDIQMPGLNGFEVLQRITNIPRVIFATAYESFAVKAFDNNAIDYLLKPFTKERFLQAIDKVITLSYEHTQKLQKLVEALQSSSKYMNRLLVENKNRLIGINTVDIIWLEALDDYSKIHTTSGQYLSSYGIGYLEKKINPEIFVKVHRSAIINLNHLQEVIKDGTDYVLTLTGGRKQKVSRTYRSSIRKYVV